jgi:nitrogen fixation protein FixH
MKGERVITGPMVLAGVLAFFAVVFAANGALVFFALESFPGLVQQKPYETGLAYNRVLEEARRQAARGWTSALRLDVDQNGSPGRVVVRMAGPDGKPVQGLAARVTLRRPLGETPDRRVTLRETAPGLYAAEESLPLAGRWTATVEAERGGQAVFRMEHELMVRQ